MAFPSYMHQKAYKGNFLFLHGVHMFLGDDYDYLNLLFYVLLADSTVDLYHFWVEMFHVISQSLEALFNCTLVRE